MSRGRSKQTAKPLLVAAGMGAIIVVGCNDSVANDEEDAGKGGSTSSVCCSNTFGPSTSTGSTGGEGVGASGDQGGGGHGGTTTGPGGAGGKGGAGGRGGAGGEGGKGGTGGQGGG